MVKYDAVSVKDCGVSIRAQHYLTIGMAVQVLRNLTPTEVAIVACIPAAAEELLFRGALIPALFPDW